MQLKFRCLLAVSLLAAAVPAKAEPEAQPLVIHQQECQTGSFAVEPTKEEVVADKVVLTTEDGLNTVSATASPCGTLTIGTFKSSSTFLLPLVSHYGDPWPDASQATTLSTPEESIDADSQVMLDKSTQPYMKKAWRRFQDPPVRCSLHVV